MARQRSARREVRRAIACRTIFRARSVLFLSAPRHPCCGSSRSTSARDFRQECPLVPLVAALTTARVAARRVLRPGLTIGARRRLARVRRVLAQPPPQRGVLGFQCRDPRSLLLDLRQQHLDLALQAVDVIVGRAHPFVRSRIIGEVDRQRATGEIRTPPRERVPCVHGFGWVSWLLSGPPNLATL